MTDLSPNLDRSSTVSDSDAHEHTSCFETSTFITSTETRPNGDLMLIVESSEYGVSRRIVPKDLKDPAEFVNRMKLDLMIQHGVLPRAEILRAVRKDNIPTYTLGKLHKTRYASLWEDRKIRKDNPLD